MLYSIRPIILHSRNRRCSAPFRMVACPRRNVCLWPESTDPDYSGPHRSSTQALSRRSRHSSHAGAVNSHYAEVDSRASQSGRARRRHYRGRVYGKRKDAALAARRRELYEFHLTVPAGVSSVHAHLDCITTNVTPNIAVLEWERLLLYPAGVPVATFRFKLR